jgi:cation diffusion facilitator family transporter
VAQTADEKRTVRATETRRAALWSVASNSVLTASKLVVGLLTNSISVISEAVHSGNDLVASLIAFFSVRKANEPADERHRYGHGKYEALSGGIEAGLIVLAALGILYAALRALITGTYEDIAHGPAVAVMGVSMVMNILVSRHLYKTASRHDSMALEADAAHLSTDVWTSGGVFVGLAMMYVVEKAGRPAHWIDPVCALLVAVLVMSQGWKIALNAKDQLLDRALPEEEVERIAAVIHDHAGRFVNFHQLRSRRAGHERHIDLHLEVCAQMTVEEAHQLTDHLEDEIEGVFPNANAMIHIEPCSDEDCKVLREAGTWTVCDQQVKREGAVV